MNTKAPDVEIEKLQQLPKEVLEFLLEVLKRKERQNQYDSDISNKDAWEKN